MQIIMYQANAFTDELFEGSPTGIVPDASNLTEKDMKRIVKITNLDKIAFVTKKDDECYNIRFFTPEDEIMFCECGSVAAFYALAQRGYIKGVENGVVRAYQCSKIGKKPIDIYFKDWQVDKVELYEDRPVSLGQYYNLDELSNILNINKEDIGIGTINLKPEILFTGIKDMIIPVKSNEIIDKLALNVDRLKNSIEMSDLDRISMFSIDENDVINYKNFEFMKSENCVNEDTSSGLIYYIKKNKLLNNDNAIYRDKSFTNRHNYIHCEIIEGKEGFPMKIAGRASIYLEGVVTFDRQ